MRDELGQRQAGASRAARLRSSRRERRRCRARPPGAGGEGWQPRPLLRERRAAAGRLRQTRAGKRACPPGRRQDRRCGLDTQAEDQRRPASRDRSMSARRSPGSLLWSRRQGAPEGVEFWPGERSGDPRKWRDRRRRERLARPCRLPLASRRQARSFLRGRRHGAHRVASGPQPRHRRRDPARRQDRRRRLHPRGRGRSDVPDHGALPAKRKPRPRLRR